MDVLLRSSVCSARQKWVALILSNSDVCVHVLWQCKEKQLSKDIPLLRVCSGNGSVKEESLDYCFRNK